MPSEGGISTPRDREGLSAIMADHIRHAARLGNEPDRSEPIAGLVHGVADSLENPFGGFICINPGKMIAFIEAT